MKEKMMIPGWGYVLFLFVFLGPLLYVHAVTAQWNPFAVNGPLFLRFYGICLAVSALAILVPRLFHPPAGIYTLLKGLLIMMAVIGLGRLCQGIYNGKPVGYLLLMLTGLVLLWRLGKRVYKKEKR
jgi:hypothetical protein